MSEIGGMSAPANVISGEPFEVIVFDSAGVPYAAGDPVQIEINGQVGPHQHLQFFGEGSFDIAVAARSADGHILDQTHAVVAVKGDDILFPGERGMSRPVLSMQPDLSKPYSFLFTVGETLHKHHPDYGRRDPVPPERRYVWVFGDDERRFTTDAPSIEVDLLWHKNVDHSRLWSPMTVECMVLPEGVVARRTLTVGSAAALTQRFVGYASPMVRNDAKAEAGEGTFTCTAYIHNVTDERIELDSRSVTAHSSDLTAESSPEPFQPFGKKIVVPARQVAVIVTQLRGGVDAPWEATGVTLRFSGYSDSGLPVRLSAVFDLPLRPFGASYPEDVGEPDDWPWDQIETGISRISEHAGLQSVSVDRQSGTVVGTIAPGDNRITKAGDALANAAKAPFERDAVDHKHLPDSASVLAASVQAFPPGTQQTMAFVTSIPPVGPVAEGEICDPDNIPDADQASADGQSLTCALTKDTISVVRPGRWALARKGDAILSPGDSHSLIADVLGSVTPAQPFSHSGIMTRNYDEITHSTASEDWLTDHLEPGLLADGSDGLQPEALRYLWPGVVAQSVQASIEGEPWKAPDNGKTYTISSFSPASGTVTGFSYMPAMIVCPDPMLEAGDPDIRKRLHAVADGIRGYAGVPAQNGDPGRNSKSHYRFYCFTDPRISETEIVAGGHGWATGTFPSVCSAVIWREMRKQGIHMENPAAATVTPADLEMTDILAGATVSPGTLDGLYSYTAEERRAAGHVLFNKVKAVAYQNAGWLGEFLTDASDQTANQIVNAFASDGVADIDNDNWKQAGGSDAVSPENILFWDGPDKNGPYGYATPACYIPPRQENYRVSKWQRYDGNARISGTVKRPNGVAVSKAVVQVVSSRSTATDAAGNYTIDNIPYLLNGGSEYRLTAGIVVDQELYTCEKTVVVNSAAVAADLILDAPPSSHRKITVTAHLVGMDDENIGSNEHINRTRVFDPVELDRTMPYKKLGDGREPTFRWGGEIRAEHTVELSLLAGGAVLATLSGRFFEGTSESTDDLEMTGSTVRQVVAPGTTGTLPDYHMWNKDEDDPDDYSTLTLSVKNEEWI